MLRIFIGIIMIMLFVFIGIYTFMGNGDHSRLMKIFFSLVGVLVIIFFIILTLNSMFAWGLPIFG